MIDSQRGALRRVGYNHLISKKQSRTLLDLADFALQEQPEHSLMVAISWAWYNGSYTMAAKPIKSLEMHYTMIQFLIMSNTSLERKFDFRLDFSMKIRLINIETNKQTHLTFFGG